MEFEELIRNKLIPFTIIVSDVWVIMNRCEGKNDSLLSLAKYFNQKKELSLWSEVQIKYY